MIRPTTLVALLVSVSAAGVIASGQTPTFRAAISLVRIDALAIDRKMPIANLTADDFEVLDNGVPQQIESILADAQPLDVMLVFDRSTSVQGQTLSHLVEASRAVLDQLKAGDRAGLMTFDTSFRLETPLTTDRALIARAIDTIEPEGATALFDALYGVLTLAENHDRRTLILLFTDGWDNLSWLPEREALNVARGSEAIVYAVASKPSNGPGPDEALLAEVTGATGGRVVLADGSNQLKSSFLEVLQEMRSRYILTYSSVAPGAPGWHTLSVRLKHRKGTVVTRRGYFLQEGPGTR